MTDAAPPKLGDLPQHSEFKVPTLESTINMSNSNGSPAMQNARDTAYNGLVSLHYSGVQMLWLTDFPTRPPNLFVDHLLIEIL